MQEDLTLVEICFVYGIIVLWRPLEAKTASEKNLRIPGKH